MQIMHSLVKARRENGANVYEFPVTSPGTAFAAVLDVPRFFSTGHASYYEESQERDNFLATFVTTGFPTSNIMKETPPDLPRLISGLTGRVGAKYRYDFNPYGTEQIEIVTEITHIVNEERIKEVRFEHECESTALLSISGFCFWKPEIPIPVTQTFVQILEDQEDGQWKVKISYNGLSAFDAREREGTANFFADLFLTTLLCPCACPILPCIAVKESITVPPYAMEQLARVMQYCDSYLEGPPRDPILVNRPAISVDGVQQMATIQSTRPGKTQALPVERMQPKETPRTISVVAGTTTQPKEIPRTIRVAAGTRPQVTNTDVEEAIPVGEEATSLRAEELEKWHKLFQSGAITQAEYESEKEKILHHI